MLAAWTLNGARFGQRRDVFYTTATLFTDHTYRARAAACRKAM